MINVMIAASYIYYRYQREMHYEIDEMKLHKLLYLSQRESLVMLDKPMFEEAFEAWKYGPVMVCVRDLYRNRMFSDLNIVSNELKEFKPVFDSVFEKYANKDSWTLSDLTHCELSWKNARNGCAEDAPCSALLDIDDIRKDAERIKMRRFYINEVLPSLNENN